MNKTPLREGRRRESAHGGGDGIFQSTPLREGRPQDMANRILLKAYLVFDRSLDHPITV